MNEVKCLYSAYVSIFFLIRSLHEEENFKTNTFT